jgi:thioredoxin-like negative regulator of GroEL
MFYAPWCGHCQRFKDEYIKLSLVFTDNVPLAAVNCNNDNTKTIQHICEIRGFPTIKIIKNGIITTDYNGERTPEGIANYFCEENVFCSKDFNNI